MIELVKNYLDNIFKTIPETEEVLKARKEIQNNMEDKFEELKSNGLSDSEALATVINEFGNIEELLEEIGSESNDENIIDTKAEELKSGSENENMPNNLSSKLWGLFFIMLAVVGLMSFIFEDEFSIFFDGWWTIFLIIPGIVGVITKKEKTFSGILLFVGIVLLIESNSDIDFIWPAILIVGCALIGLRLVFKNNNILNWKMGEDSDLTEDVAAIFGGANLDYTNFEFEEDITIKCTAIFGGIDIIVPNNVNIFTTGSSLFGGVKKRSNVKNAEYTIYIHYLCIFGGMEIK